MHVEKYKACQCGQMLAHYNRNNGEDRNYSNENIDKDKTERNYNLAPDRGMTEMEYMEQRLSEVKHLNRADVVRMADWIVTLPSDYKGDDREFFEKTYTALANRYGEQNVISAYVHMDEKTPHMHFAFMPCVGDRLCAKEVLTREELREIHPYMEKCLSRNLEHEVHLLNGATRDGNKAVKELKRESAVKDLEKVRTYEKLIEKDMPTVAPKKGLRGEYVPFAEHEKAMERMKAEMYSVQLENKHLREDKETEQQKAEHYRERLRESEIDRNHLLDRLDDVGYLRERVKELEKEAPEHDRDRDRDGRDR